MSYWSKLSMKDKADVMRLFLDRGISDLDTMRREYNTFAEGGKIHIDPSKKGTFTAAASRHGMGVQEFASKVLANKENYSPAMVKKANFARNASKWHGFGGNLFEEGGDTSYSYIKPLDNVFVDSEGNLLDPNIPSARGTVQLPEVIATTRDPRKPIHSINTLNPLNVSNSIGQALRNRMYRTVPPTGYTLSRVEDFITGGDGRLYEDANTEAMYGMYTGQDSIIGGIHKFKDWGTAPGRKITTEEAEALQNPSLASDGLDSGYRKIAVKDLVRPSSIEKGAYEFIFPEYSDIPNSGIKAKQHSHNHSLGTYTLIPGEDKEGKYVDYFDVWDINPFRGISSIRDGDFFSIGPKIGLDKFEDIVPWGLPTRIYGRRREVLPE